MTGDYDSSSDIDILTAGIETAAGSAPRARRRAAGRAGEGLAKVVVCRVVPGVALQLVEGRAEASAMPYSGSLRLLRRRPPSGL